MSVAHLHNIEHIAYSRHHLQFKRLAKWHRGRQSRAIGGKQGAILGNHRKSTVLAVYIYAHIAYGTTILYYSVAILCAAGRVNRGPIDLVAHKIHTICKVGRQGERGWVEHIGIGHTHTCAVVSHTRVQCLFGIREGHNIAIGGICTILVKHRIESTILSAVEIDKTIHPVTCKAEHGCERLACHCSESGAIYLTVYFKWCGHIYLLVAIGRAIERHAVKTARTVCIVHCLVEHHGIVIHILCHILGDKFHTIYVAHPTSVIKAHYVVALVQSDIDIHCAHCAPATTVCGNLHGSAIVHAHQHLAALARDE